MPLGVADEVGERERLGEKLSVGVEVDDTQRLGVEVADRQRLGDVETVDVVV